MKTILPNEITKNCFEMVGKDWMLITAEKDGKVNTMTASWGGTGVLWNKKVAFIFVRESRYTKEFIDAGTKLSLSVLPDKYRNELTYFGRASGRDEDKIAKAGLEISYEDGVPYFSESDLAFICTKLYAQPMQAECFIDKSIIDAQYSDNDWHTTYVIEIDKVLEK